MSNLNFYFISVPLLDNTSSGTRGTILQRMSVSTASSEEGSITRMQEEERSNSESDLSNVVPHSNASGGWGQTFLIVGIKVVGVVIDESKLICSEEGFVCKSTQCFEALLTIQISKLLDETR